jgi:hypothetical protein
VRCRSHSIDERRWFCITAAQPVVDPFFRGTGALAHRLSECSGKRNSMQVESRHHPAQYGIVLV